MHCLPADAAAADPRIDGLRAMTTVSEEPRYTAEYLEAGKRSIGNTVEVQLTDGTVFREALDYVRCC